jgi:hypothetical protein
MARSGIDWPGALDPARRGSLRCARQRPCVGENPAPTSWSTPHGTQRSPDEGYSASEPSAPVALGPMGDRACFGDRQRSSRSGRRQRHRRPPARWADAGDNQCASWSQGRRAATSRAAISHSAESATARRVGHPAHDQCCVSSLQRTPNPRRRALRRETIEQGRPRSRGLIAHRVPAKAAPPGAPRPAEGRRPHCARPAKPGITLGGAAPCCRSVAITSCEAVGCQTDFDRAPRVQCLPTRAMSIGKLVAVAASRRRFERY